MILYFDTSVLVSLFLREERTEAATRLIADALETIIVSELGEGEFGAAISTSVRTKRLTEVQGAMALESADIWLRTQARPMQITSSDMRAAISLVRRFDLALLFPDALHLALCARANAALVTGDQRQAEAARTLGMTVTLL